MNARSTTLDDVEYAPGRRFRVVKPGLYLRGWKADAPSSWRGWRLDLQVGEEVRCLGFGAGFGSDPGYGVHWDAGEPGVSYATISPEHGGPFAYRPVPGFLEPVEEGDGDAGD